MAENVLREPEFVPAEVPAPLARVRRHWWHPASLRRWSWRRWTALGAALLLVLGAVASYAALNTPQAIATTTVSYGMVERVITADGTVQAPGVLALTFPGSGTVTQVAVKAGQSVSAGQLLGSLDGAAAHAQLRAAQANLSVAQDRLNQLITPATDAALANQVTSVSTSQLAVSDAQRALLDVQMVTAQDVASAQVALTTANAQVTQAQQALTTEQGSGAADVVAVANAQVAVTRANSIFTATQNEFNMTYLQAAYDQAKIDLDNFHSAAAFAAAAAAYQALHAADVVIATAQQGVDAANAQLALAKAARTTGLTAAQNAVTNAQQAQQSAASAQSGAQARATQAVDAATAQLDQAQSALKAAQAGLSTGRLTATAAQIQASSDEVAASQAGVDQAQAAVAQTELRSPLAGVVEAVDYHVGDVAGLGGGVSGTNSILLLPNVSLWVSAKLAEADVNQVKAGQAVTVSVDAMPGSAIPAHIARIQDVANVTAEGIATYRTETTFDNPPSGLRAGMHSTVNIVVAHKAHVLTVPNTALHFAGGRYDVQRQRADGHFESVQVALGIRGLAQSEVIWGLRPGDRVARLNTTTVP